MSRNAYARRMGALVELEKLLGDRLDEAIEAMEPGARKFIRRQLKAGRWRFIEGEATAWRLAVPTGGTWAIVLDVPDDLMTDAERLGLVSDPVVQDARTLRSA